MASLRSCRTHFNPSFRAEELESRQLLSTVDTGGLANVANVVVQPSWGWYWYPGGGGGGGGGGTGTGGGGGGTSTSSSRPPTGNFPSVISQAYGFNQIAFSSNGTTVTGDGSGQTIAIVDAYNDPNIASDLATFDTQFGLAAPPSLTVLNQNGSSTALPSTSASWAQEISLDVEWAHAMAPGAKIVLVEANSSSLSDLLTAVTTAAHQRGVSVVSMSWGTTEFASETTYDSTFNVPGVTFVASSGDSGGIQGAEWPAASPNVLSVGGTTLTTASGGAYAAESAWSGISSGSGGGVSRYESTPTYQQGTLPVTLTGRSTPDVSYNANPATGFAVYDSLAYQGAVGWLQVGGTSAGTPQWAALVAIANQGRVLNQLGTLGSQATLTGLYGLAGTLYQQTPSSVFHDITSGYNAAGSASLGLDRVTGLGSPIANALVASLSGHATTTPTPTPTSTTDVGVTTKGSTTPAPKQTHPHGIAAPPVTTVLIGVSPGPVVSVLAPAVPSTATALAPPSATTPAQTAATNSTASSATLGRGQSVEVRRESGTVRLFLRETRPAGAPATRGRDPLGPHSPLDEEPALTDQDPAGVLRAAPAAAAAPAGRGVQAPDAGAGEVVAPPPAVPAAPPMPEVSGESVRGGVLGGVAIAFGLAWIGRSERRAAVRRRPLLAVRSFEDLRARN